MTIGIHPKCLDRLIEALSEFLDPLKTMHGIFIEPDSIGNTQELDRILSDEITRKTEKFIGDQPFSTFIITTIIDDLKDRYNYTENANISDLKNLPDYSDVKSVAQRLVDQFKTLPWQYHITYKFGNFLAKDLKNLIGNYKISDEIELFIPDTTTRSEYSLESGIENRDVRLFKRDKLGLLGSGIFSDLLFDEQPYWGDECFLRIKIDGFVGAYRTTKTVRRAEFFLKAFMGFCISHKIFRFDPYSQYDFVEWMVIHEMKGMNKSLVKTHELPDDITTGTNKVFLNTSFESKDSQAAKELAFNILESISKPFKVANDSEKLLLASNWYFDSITNKNSLLSFVQAVVVLEILLGDKSKSDILGLGELLRNRCAYLISRNRKERDDLLLKFNKIYNVRSEIVHGGKNELDNTETQALIYLQYICARVLQEEVNHITL